MKGDNAWTLEEAKAWLLERLEKGIACPCCDQFAKIYTRKLNSSMARGLIWLCDQAPAREWVEVNRIGPRWLVSKGGTLATLQHWSFIEEQPNERDTTKRTSGIWRPTWDGIAFARRETTTLSHVRLYDNQVLGFAGDHIDIAAALGERFDYSELMSTGANPATGDTTPLDDVEQWLRDEQ